MTIQLENNRLTPEDYTALRPDIPYAVAARAIRGSSLTLRAVAGGQVIGMLRALCDGAMFCYFHDVFVSQPWRRRGVGRAMLTEALAQFQSALAPGEYLVVTALAEPGREGFYQACGFAAAQDGCAMQGILQG